MSDVAKQVNPAKTRKGKKILEERGPLLEENDKKTMFVKGNNTSQVVNDVMADLYKTRRQHSVMLNKKNPILPFETTDTLKDLMVKQDTSLFVFGSHNKKRPNNLVLGRTYDGKVLDMIEFGITKHKLLKHFKNPKVPLGAKPCLIFNGDMFEKYDDWGVIRNFFSDFFCVAKTSSINLEGLVYIISITATEPNNIFIRSYEVNMKKSGTHIPYVALDPIGISLDLTLRRTKFAEPELRRLALKQPKALKVGKTKNVSHDMAGSKFATIHMTKQIMSEMPQSKMKVSKRNKNPDQRTPKKVKKNPELESMDTS